MIIDKVLYPRTEDGKKIVSLRERKSRSLFKTVSWRILGTLDTVLISWIVTGSSTFALSIGLIELITKMLLYYCHERVWNSIPWGR